MVICYGTEMNNVLTNMKNSVRIMKRKLIKVNLEILEVMEAAGLEK